MKLRIKNIALLSILLISTSLVGCIPVSMGIMEKRSDIEKVALTVLNSDELISIKETELDEKTKKNLYNKYNEIILPIMSEKVSMMRQ